ncbi:GNAT family N-acetyltransferase [Mucilaginibacter auburnensis]|uniref:RimJ/RimL family protein N-acetyltransferase n=1 Tax=Mucilaginibacter auburnensis TaxID=1457233 RepID=A0A2H9VP81_9SPHI|nr:GNAT family protein [Mucilaginibacter auburnensis]PJJ80154.1 RimJ/RimL family protein N-acetyltransferase [Mucilaginibacter auburnensis]
MSLNFKTTQNIILENERVLLRPLQAEDFDHLLPFALNEPEIWRYSARTAESAALLKEYIDGAIKAREAGAEYPFIVFDKKANAYAGSTRFYEIQPENGALEIGYTWYGKDFRGSGLNKHCKFLLLQFAFETMQTHRVGFRADARNEVSIAAMKSIGCTVEGVIRSHGVLRDGGRRDSVLLSILKDEWFGGVKERLKGKTTC